MSSLALALTSGLTIFMVGQVLAGIIVLVRLWMKVQLIEQEFENHVEQAGHPITIAQIADVSETLSEMAADLKWMRRYIERALFSERTP